MIRVLVCAGVQPAFFEATADERRYVFDKCREVFGSWKERYGIEVLSSMDDDQIQIGPTFGYPWTFYVMCDAPSHEVMIDVVDQLRRGDKPLFKYIKVDVRMGRPLSDLGLP
ncbi:MAG: IacB protein [Gemmatimonadetes bacterium]|nr:IacB protein [Gemmatimonadota bacterium]